MEWPFSKYKIIVVAALACINCICISTKSTAQETNSNISAIVTSNKNARLATANISLVHQPTKNIYKTVSRSDGQFYFTNLKPGGPYTITISFTGFESLERHNLFVGFNSSNYFLDSKGHEVSAFELNEDLVVLPEVIARASLAVGSKRGIETSINQHQLQSLPSISRNLQDYVRLVPQSKVSGNGMMSLAGQNNKFNAFFIDGANNNDIAGIAMSGTNGGQTNTPPISIEALEEIKVLLAPFDVQYSNFTGGSINAITKSGTNQFKSAVWYFFRNEDMAGRSPVPVKSPGNPDRSSRPKLAPFFNQTFGFWHSGPIVKNKLFFFISIEKQLEESPQLFNFSGYKGKTNKPELLAALVDTLRKKYNYDPGSFDETAQKINATRTIFKADWNPGVAEKITFSYRYNLASRLSPRTASSTVMPFENSGLKTSARTHVASLEWKHFFKNGISNRLLFTYTHQRDDPHYTGKPFPSVTILDGAGSIFFGSIPISHFTLFKATDLTLFDAFKFVKGKHNLSTGFDINFTKINDLTGFDYFGNYRYRSLDDFLKNRPAFRYTRTLYPQEEAKDENKTDGSTYRTRRIGLFINDEINISQKFMLNAGIRVEGNALPQHFEPDHFFNDTASPIISKYYSLDGAQSGSGMKPHWQIAPRLGFVYKLPEKNFLLKGGAGLFVGRILNIWHSAMYPSGLNSISINPQAYALSFIPNPLQQPTFASLGILPGTAKGELNLISEKFKYPVVFRSSVSAEKKLNKGWRFSGEALFTQNIHEWKITNVNIAPPSELLEGPGARPVYSYNNFPESIALQANGANPYTAIYLLSNNKSNKGFSYSFSTIADKTFSHYFGVTAGYVYGKSYALFEPYGTAGPVGNQWAQSETVNGKNFSTRSVSDLDPGHRIYLNLYKKINYYNNKIATAISLFYNGQSGQPYSYVYSGSIINDNGVQSNFDLVYIPTKEDLLAMTFLPIVENGVVIHTPQQQKELLNFFIEGDNYLGKNRGRFAERNGARLPFSHIVDLRMQQDFTLRLNKKPTTVSIIFDVFNFTNMLNKNWGRMYFLSFDQYPLIRFAGFNHALSQKPEYQFTPPAEKFSIQSGTSPGSSARWVSQLGVRIHFN